MNKRMVPIGLHILKSLISIKCGKRVPLYCEWEITNRCNMDCSFCSTRNARRNNGTETSTEEALKIIHELHELGTKMLHISGGEPTLRRDLDEIINVAHENGMLVAFTTNGTASKETMKKLTNADLIRVSIDGFGKSHDELRKSPGAFEKAIKTVELLLSFKKKVFVTTVYTNKTNEDNLHKLISTAQAIGVRISIMPASKNINETNDGMVDCELTPVFDDYVALIARLRKAYGRTIVNPKYYINIIKKGGLDSYGCRAMDISISIKSDGSVSLPCTGLQIDMKKGALRDIYYGRDASVARPLQGEYPGCKGCPIICMTSASSLLKIGGLKSIICSYMKNLNVKPRNSAAGC